MVSKAHHRTSGGDPHPGRRTRPPRLEIDIDGGLVRLRPEYEPRLISLVRKLPDRRYSSAHREWTMPARRAGLAELCDLVESSGIDARLTERARRRLEHQGPGRITFEDGDFRLAFSYSPRRLERIRRIPERRFDPTSKTWAVAATRAGAPALLALLAEHEFRAEPSVRARLKRLATERADAPRPRPVGREAGAPSRRSPVPHWRHVTRGRVFDANRHRQEWIDGIGWCVRIRVDPARQDGRRP